MKTKMKTPVFGQLSLVGKLALGALISVMAHDSGIGAEISAGAGSSYARLPNGTVKAWGQNGQFGRIGVGNTSDAYYYAPTNVVYLSNGSPLTNVRAVAGGKQHALALLSDGTIAAWGANASGQLGIGNLQDKSAAVATTGITTATAIDAGWGFSLALLSDGTVYGWGNNDDGRIGSGVVIGGHTNAPTQVLGLSDIEKIAVGTKHCLALDVNGDLWAWGEGRSGKLGNNSTNNQSNAVQVVNLQGVTAIAAAVGHSLAVTNGVVMAWGEGANGRLGHNATSDSHIPVQVINHSYSDYCGNTFSLQGKVVAVAAGENHSLALTSDGRVWAWGKHEYGQLGIGGSSTGEYSTPVPVKDATGNDYLKNVVAIAAAKHSGSDTYVHSMALLSDGSIFAWGQNTKGQLAVDPNGTAESTLPLAVDLNQ